MCSRESGCSFVCTQACVCVYMSWGRTTVKSSDSGAILPGFPSCLSHFEPVGFLQSLSFLICRMGVAAAPLRGRP